MERQHHKDVNSPPNLIYTFNVIFSKNDKLILKFLWKDNDLWITKLTLKWRVKGSGGDCLPRFWEFYIRFGNKAV